MKTLVVTRPAAQSASWAQALEKQGFTVHTLPLLNIRPLKKGIQEVWEQLVQLHWIMFVSPNAVDAFFHTPPRVETSFPVWPAMLRAGATGSGTAQALADCGVPLSLIDQPDANAPKDTEHLWQRIGNRTWSGLRTLIVRGTGLKPDRNWLLQQLQLAGAHVRAVPVYERTAPRLSEADALWLQSPEARAACWIFSSAEAFEYLPHYDWHSTAAIVTHQRIAQAAHQAGFGQVICASGPDVSSIANSVKSVV